MVNSWKGIKLAFTTAIQDVLGGNNLKQRERKSRSIKNNNRTVKSVKFLCIYSL